MMREKNLKIESGAEYYNADKQALSGKSIYNTTHKLYRASLNFYLP